MEVLRQDNWTAEVTSELRNFEKSLIVALKEKGWDGKESLDTVTWSFTGGLFYSITGMWGLNQAPLQYLEQRKQVHFKQTDNQGLRKLYWMVSCDLRA